MVLQALAIHLALDFRRAIERRFHRSEFLDQVARALVADARRARDVVDGISFQRQQIRHLRRLHAHELLHLGFVVPEVVLHRIQHGRAARDELQHVFIARYDDDFHAGLFGAPRNRADHIIRLKAGILQNGNPHRLDDPAYVGYLLGQVWRHFRAVRFVFGEYRASKRRVPFECYSHIFRLLFLDNPKQCPQISQNRVCEKARGRDDVVREPMIGSEDVVHRIDYVNGLFHTLIGIGFPSSPTATYMTSASVTRTTSLVPPRPRRRVN